MEIVYSGTVELVDHMGSDLSVVNAARVSFNKRSDKLSEKDQKLIDYLAKHKHWTPFGHAFASFRIDAPVFVARQLAKHQVGLTWNEVSRRYVAYEPEVWAADKWRKAALNKKQGSSDEPVLSNNIAAFTYTDACRHAVDAYASMIKMGVCPEQARAVLPQGMMTQWVWSGSLFAFARICSLRLKPDTQQETRRVAVDIDYHCNRLFPYSWKALRSSEHPDT